MNPTPLLLPKPTFVALSLLELLANKSTKRLASEDENLFHCNHDWRMSADATRVRPQIYLILHLALSPMQVLETRMALPCLQGIHTVPLSASLMVVQPTVPVALVVSPSRVLQPPPTGCKDSSCWSFECLPWTCSSL